jgi:hypothetical protein
VIAKTTLHVSWFVKASVQQGLKSCLCGGARQRGEERNPLDFDSWSGGKLLRFTKRFVSAIVCL